MSRRTLLIALNTTCSQCAESVRLVHKLTAPNANQTYGDIRVLLLFPNDESDVSTYLKQYDLASEAHAVIDLRSHHINVVPTMILVDDKGVIKDFRTALLSPMEAADFLNVLEKSK